MCYRPDPDEDDEAFRMVLVFAGSVIFAMVLGIIKLWSMRH